MPQGIYSHLMCIDNKKKGFTPTQHQKDAVKAFMKSPYKGLLLYHKLGSGKTCTAIMIADKLLRKNKISHVYIFSPGSLRQGWIREYCSICGTDNMRENFTYITYNYAVGKRLPNLDNSLVIVDEIHNLVNGYKNKSQNPTAIFDTIMQAKCRILALSGTPIFHYMTDAIILACLLKNEEKLIGMNEDDIFHFVGNRRILSPAVDDLFTGIISYYPGSGDEFMPKIIYKNPIKVEMSMAQTIFYWGQEKSERQLGKAPPSKKMLPEYYNLFMRLFIMARKHIMTRSASNFLYPRKVKDKVQIEDYGVSYMKKFYVDLPKEQGGWVCDKYIRNGKLLKYSRKFIALFLNIVLHIQQKHVIFSFFKENSGVILLKTLFSRCGISCDIFTGDMDDASRKQTLARFNDPNNRYGDKVRILLVTEAGAEGISILEARHIHILESSPRISKIIQVIGRVARFRSHIALPPEERNVSVWKYISISNRDFDTDRKTIDEILDERGMEHIMSINNLQEEMQKKSVTPF